MKAITREEKIISGENLTPITRKEMFLAKASGQNIQTPTPITREEYFLSKITGGGGSVEGTAIPVGEKVEKIYFNTNNTIKETNAYLSQLTYLDVGLGYPINVIFASQHNFIVAAKDDNDRYIILHNTALSSEGNILVLFAYENDWTRNGWITSPITIIEEGEDNTFEDVVVSRLCVDCISLSNASYADLDGLPVGAENEKIKNVLSITPFGASGTSNKPAAYTVSSVDELPSDAVDGSMAIVESDSLIGEWEWKDNQSPLDLSMLNGVEEDAYNFATVSGKDEMTGVVFRNFEFKNGAIYLHNGSMGYLLYEDGVFDDVYTKFSLYTDVTDTPPIFTIDDFKTFIKTNCNRLSGGKSLYTHENGEWVYKREVV